MGEGTAAGNPVVAGARTDSADARLDGTTRPRQRPRDYAAEAQAVCARGSPCRPSHSDVTSWSWPRRANRLCWALDSGHGLLTGASHTPDNLLALSATEETQFNKHKCPKALQWGASLQQHEQIHLSSSRQSQTQARTMYHSTTTVYGSVLWSK